MPYFPEEPEEIDRLIDELLVLASEQKALSVEMGIWIDAAKQKMSKLGPVCAEIAGDIDSTNEAIFAEGFAEQHFPALYFVKILRSCYGLKEGLFTNPAERAEQINTLRGRIKDLLYEHAFPLAVTARKTEGQRRRGGLDSHGLTAEERQERNRLIQAEVDRLCLERGLSYSRACATVAANISKIYEFTETISHDRIKKLTTNPHRKNPSL